MRWIRFLLIFLIALLVIIGAGVTFLLTLDLNDYKEPIAGLVKRQTGRTLELDGRIDLDLGMLTTLELSDARFANPEWASRPYMARLERAKVVLNLRSLLDGPVVFEAVELHNAELHIEALEDGRNNWTFGSPAADTTPEPVAAKKPANDAPIPLMLRDVQGSEWLFTLAIPALPRPLIIHANQASQQQRADGMVDAKIEGSLNDRKIDIGGSYGTLSNVLRATTLEYDVAGRFDSLDIRSKGFIDKLTGPEQPTIALRVSGPAIDDVTEMIGVPDLGEGGIDVEASLEPDDDGISAHISGRIGEYTADTRAHSASLTNFDRFFVQTDILGPDLGKAMGIFGVAGVPGGPFEVRGGIERDGNRLDIDDVRMEIAAAALTLDGSIRNIRNLEEARLTLRVQGDDIKAFGKLLRLPVASSGPFRVDGNLGIDPDGRRLVDGIVQTNLFRMQVDGELAGEAPGFIGSAFRARGDFTSLADLADATGLPALPDVTFIASGEVELGEQKVIARAPVTAEFGTNTLTLDGTVGFAPLQDTTDLNVRASGEDLALVLNALGIIDNGPAATYDIAGRVTVEPKNYRISGLAATIGETRIELEGNLSKAPGLSGSRADFTISGRDPYELVAGLELPRLPRKPYTLSGNAELLDESVRLNGIRGIFENGSASLNAEIALPPTPLTVSFDLQAEGPDLSAVTFKTDAWNPPALPFTLSAKADLSENALKIESLTASVADARIDATGQFDLPPDLSRTDLKINADLPSLANLGTFNGRRFQPTPVSLNIEFIGTLDSFRIEPLTGRIGRGDIDGWLNVNLQDDVPDVVLQLRSKLLDLDSLEQIAEEIEPETDSSADKGQPPTAPAAQSRRKRAIPDTPLPLEQLRALNATLDFDAPTVLYRNVEYRDVKIHGVLQDGRLTVDQANGETEFGKLEATLSLVPEGDTAELSATLDGQGLMLNLSEMRSKEEIAEAPKLDADIDLNASGGTTRELAATLNGAIRISSAGGRIRNSRFSLFVGDFIQELLTAVNPFVKEDPTTELSCLEFLVSVTDGKVSVDPGFVAQTDKINILAKGEVDLNSERIDIGFKTQPRSRVSISAAEFINPYLKVGGTLADPRLAVDPTGAIITGGAAFATGGLSLLATAVWDRAFREDDPCAAAVEASLNSDKKQRRKFLGIF